MSGSLTVRGEYVIRYTFWSKKPIIQVANYQKRGQDFNTVLNVVWVDGTREDLERLASQDHDFGMFYKTEW